MTRLLVPKQHVLLCITALLFSVSARVVTLGAGEEPYSVVRPMQGFIQVGLGCALMMLWVQASAWVVWQVRAKRMPRAWLLFLTIAAVSVFYLRFAVTGYLLDLDGAAKTWTQDVAQAAN